MRALQNFGFLLSLMVISGCVNGEGRDLSSVPEDAVPRVSLLPIVAIDSSDNEAIIHFVIENREDFDICIAADALRRDRHYFDLGFQIRDKRKRVLPFLEAGFLPPSDGTEIIVKPGGKAEATFDLGNRIDAEFTEEFVRKRGPFEAKSFLRLMRCKDRETLLANTPWQAIELHPADREIDQ